MIETKFKVLIHTGEYVDSSLLEKGIYSTSRPTLYGKDATIEELEKRGRTMKDITGELFLSEKYFENLRLCKLVDATLVTFI
ncbi:MAG: hypothetical protein M0P71_16890 [Melioribacteraceae bacterium]|jgi:hypothetical protein|nr:hypothetical protein [Melioribacteraceae bacterium]